VLVLVDDCGTVINPLLVDGQLVGGAAQGIGEPPRELIRCSDEGQLQTGTLLDYAIARAADIPPLLLDCTVTPSPPNPLVVALRPLGVDNVEVPVTAEQIWRLLKGGQ
jgi:carbon-monoxide dehydrogenase large subunit